ncbi:GNAT family N-acetyltransferase [Rhizobacter sp. AJA081-3]|uniref:GNAT family N-acetyltransferase n=1 Tax=Rhizobacter sp. AJA081-3 TaxID=2753607 RepID=UPI001FD7C488|nr:GNAT family N-acetyltransferase [Rhizobacter sp. AJA081-3]
MSVRLATQEDRLPVYRMLELYQHDLSDIWDQDLDSHGEYGYALDHYWHEEGSQAFVATVAGKYAGFALVNRAVRVGTEGCWMDQFFVLKKFRRRGLGQHLAGSVFAALPGRWEVGQMPTNLGAQSFWRKVIGEYTGGRFKEQTLRSGGWQGVVQVFDTRA